MRISIEPVVIDDIVCTEAEVSVAVSNSVAIRVVPVDAEGNEHPAAAMGVVGTQDQEDIVTFMADLTTAVDALLAARGI